MRETKEEDTGSGWRSTRGLDLAGRPAEDNQSKRFEYAPVAEGGGHLRIHPTTSTKPATVHTSWMHVYSRPFTGVLLVNQCTRGMYVFTGVFQQGPDGVSEK